VRDLCGSDEAEGVAGGHGGSAGSGAHLEAAHVWAVDVGDAVVGLVVFGLADRGPFFGFGDAVDDEAGETVCFVEEDVSEGLKVFEGGWRDGRGDVQWAWAVAARSSIDGRRCMADGILLRTELRGR
jgi:hypothetical protein